MAEEQTPISRALSDVFTGLYKKKRLTQDVFAARSRMSIVTLQKKLKGKAPISATDLVLMAKALEVDPGAVIEEALEDMAEAARKEAQAKAEAESVSAPVASLDARRKKPVDMTDEELERERHAAGTDAELEEDEPFA